MAHTFDEQLYRLLDIVESIELEPFTANVYPVYAERNTNVRVSRRESLEGVRALVDARLETLQRIATKIDFLERDLHYRRACLVNAHAPVEVLPPEVLGEIFATAVAASPPLQARRLAVTISHVSSFWRAVAIRQPMMWRRVVLCDNNRSWHPRWSLPGLAEEWIRRASNSPLDVLVEQQFFQTLRRLEIPNWKIRSLSLVDVNIESDQAFSAPSDWNYIRDLSLPSLETLCITTSPLAEPMVTFTTNTNSFPSLRNLIITGNWRRLLWDLVPVYGMQLRGLFLKGGCVGVGTYRTISQFCPSLEVLCLDDNVADFSAADMDEGEIWEFKTITDLEARNFSPELSNMLARHACFPNLRSFVFTTMDTGVERDPVAHQNVLRGMVQKCKLLEDLELCGSQKGVGMLLERFLETTMPEFVDDLDPSTLSYTGCALPPSLHTIRLSWTQHPESLLVNLSSIIYRLRSRLWNDAGNVNNVHFPEMISYPTVASFTSHGFDHVFGHLKDTGWEAEHREGFEERVGRIRLIFFGKRPSRLSSNLFYNE